MRSMFRWFVRLGSRREERHAISDHQIAIRFRLPAHVTREGDWFVAYCPAMDVSSQGRTRDEALSALTEAVTATLEFCIEQNTIDQVLRSLGFRQGKPDHIEDPADDVIDVPIDLIADAANRSRSVAATC
jgi:Uncharacterized conserved protein